MQTRKPKNISFGRSMAVSNGKPVVPLLLAQKPTPFYRLDVLSELWGGDIWIKRDDLTEAGAAGNKIRKLEYLMADARIHNADTIITCGGVNSNHCRATALTSARLGLRCILILREIGENKIDGNLLLDHLAGAEIELVSDEAYYDDLDKLLSEKASQVKSEGGKPYIITEGGSDPLGALGYVDQFSELNLQCIQAGVRPDRVICATGSGGTHAGLFAGALMEAPEVDIVSASVCYEAEETRHRIGVIVDGMIDRHKMNLRYTKSDISVVDGYIGPGYAQAGQDEFEIIAEVARAEGLLVDPVYTGKAIRAVKEETLAGRMPGTTVFIHTGGLFGLFPFREGLGKV